MANPKDSTIRNVKASKSRDDKLLERIKKLEAQEKEIKDLKRRVKKIEEALYSYEGVDLRQK
jgi:hypothetical protein